MSDQAIGRRVDIMVHVEGVDISKAITKSLISLSYTDNEEDVADDLSIKLEDRDGVWLREWLNYTVQSAAVAGALAGNKDDTTKQYRVTKKDVIIREGPVNSYKGNLRKP